MSKSITSETPLPLPIPASDELGPLVGRTFGGYEITSYIGEGPTGAVYRAEDLVGSRMAVKVMHKELSTKPAADKLWADLQKLTALRLPSLVKTYDAGFDDEGQFYYTMDELIGCDLEAGLEETGALAPSKALEIVRQICAVLEATHSIGIVHGGLKPRNVFLEPTDRELVVKVLDFGAGRLAGGVDKGVIVGNPFYMAPEQFGGTADARTDIYSLGVLMYELFSGTLPFSGPSHGQVMMRHLAEVPQPPPGVDEELGRIILRALVKNPAGRYGTIRHLLAAVDRWAASSPSLLQDSAAFAVISRAEEARVMKQAALSAPDATSPMPKLDLAELARGTRERGDTPPIPGVSVSAGGGKNDKPQNGAESSNSSESVEASLEDFISQANASFPTSGAVTADGWDLHTGDVELLDEAEEQLESEEHVAAPAAIKAKGDSQKGKTPKRETKSVKAVAPIIVEEPSAPVKKSRTGSMPAVQAHHTPPRVQVAEALDESGPEPEPLDPPPSAPRRKVERTEVVSSPIPLSSGSNVPWTANPLVIIGGLLAAFIIGAGLVFLMVRTMMPTQQPVVVQAPPQPVVVQPAPAPVPSAPIVTPLPQNPVAAAPAPTPAPPVAGAPVVTQLPPPAPVPVPAPAPAPQVAAPAPQAAAPAPVPAAAAPVPAEPVKRAAPKHVVAAPKKKAAPVEKEPVEKAEKPAKAAAAPKAEKPAAKPAKAAEKKGSDWVDPFAQ